MCICKYISKYISKETPETCAACMIFNLLPEDAPTPRWAVFLAGALAGCTATCLTFPLDVVRTRIALECPVDANLATCLVGIGEAEGIGALYRGLSATVAGILRRGMTVAGLKTFILSMGASRNTNMMEWDRIWATNRDVVDPTAARYTALAAEGLVPFELAGAPAEPYAESLFKHPKDQTLGKKVRLFAKTVLLQYEDAKVDKEAVWYAKATVPLDGPDGGVGTPELSLRRAWQW